MTVRFGEYEDYILFELSKMPNRDAIIRMLPEREQPIIRLRFGFDGRMHTFTEIAKLGGHTRDRIRMIHAKACNHLGAIFNRINPVLTTNPNERPVQSKENTPDAEQT